MPCRGDRARCRVAAALQLDTPHPCLAYCGRLSADALLEAELYQMSLLALAQSLPVLASAHGACVLTGISNRSVWSLLVLVDHRCLLDLKGRHWACSMWECACSMCLQPHTPCNVCPYSTRVHTCAYYELCVCVFSCAVGKSVVNLSVRACAVCKACASC